MELRPSSNGRNERIALGSQLKHCPSVVTLGVRPNFDDYTEYEMDLIRQAKRVYFPTVLYVDALNAMRKETFPSVHCYRHLGDKIKQTHLFQLLGIPMPHTRLYYARQTEENILDEFALPFVAKMPRGSSRGEGVFLIQDRNDLHAYMNKTRVALIQQYMPLRQDIRIVVVGKRIVHAYWKEAARGEYRTNLAKGGKPILNPVPEAALESALEVALRCGFDHVGLDFCEDRGRYLILEANMVFGTMGFRAAGLDYKSILKRMVEKGEI